MSVYQGEKRIVSFVDVVKAVDKILSILIEHGTNANLNIDEYNSLEHYRSLLQYASEQKKD